MVKCLTCTVASVVQSKVEPTAINSRETGWTVFNVTEVLGFYIFIPSKLLQINTYDDMTFKVIRGQGQGQEMISSLSGLSFHNNVTTNHQRYRQTE